MREDYGRRSSSWLEQRSRASVIVWSLLGRVAHNDALSMVEPVSARGGDAGLRFGRWGDRCGGTMGQAVHDD